MDQAAADSFIAKWTGVTASELSTSQSFLIDLCHLLGVETPHPTPDHAYMFERPITFQNGDGSTRPGRIDLYRKGAFVLESKKLKAGAHTKGFDDAMLRARSQAENYARALPAAEGRPPFVVVVDVGHRLELYSEFSRSGATYIPFPDPANHRIVIEDLRRPEILDRLRRIWTEPMSLDPSRESARVTREIADRLAKLARSLEASGHAADQVSQFLMRCLFTMFAEDVRLLPDESFRDLLTRHAEQPEVAMAMLGQLWRDMDSGGFSAAIAAHVVQFNGKLFKTPDTLPLDRDQIGLLIQAARADWRHVEPAIFGTLLERALSPTERHKLGAHYTPRAYVERLVLPTVIEPLRREWSTAQAAALTLAAEGKTDDAVAQLLAFHHRLCTIRVLDPACGSANFLYVTLEHLKRLEGEVLNALDELGHRQTGLALGGERADAVAGETVDPHNLLGIELNPRAAAIAEVVLWIGYLQWHFRTRGDVKPPIPVIRDFRNIENRDAVLEFDGIEPVLDAEGHPVTRWDGLTTKLSPTTGEQIPDDRARVPVVRYIAPRKASWPQADFVVGNPPFIGNKRMRAVLGDGYVEALRQAWPDVPDSAELVMYWWHHAAALTRSGAIESFGLITTNSITQSFNRRVVDAHMLATDPIRIVMAAPDHPWVDGSDRGAVRIAMSVGSATDVMGRVLEIDSEEDAADGEKNVTFRVVEGAVDSMFKVGAAVHRAQPLNANSGLCWQGCKLVGAHFQITPEQRRSFIAAQPEASDRLPRYTAGSDIARQRTERYVIDTFGLEEQELLSQFPPLYQHLHDYVYPERRNNKDAGFRNRWWQMGRPRPDMRKALDGLSTYIATSEVAKFRVFTRLHWPKDLCDGSVVVIASDDDFILGVVSSSVGVAWANAAAGRMGVGNDLRYNTTACFDTLAFPAASSEQRARIADAARVIIDHRVRQQTLHPDLTLTSIYNVLEKLRAGDPLTPKERDINERGLVTVLRKLHDNLDAAVLAAYGWGDLGTQNAQAGAEISSEGHPVAKETFEARVLQRLVTLNAQRAAEEASGQVRWLRPEYQAPTRGTPEQARLAAGIAESDNSREVMSPAFQAIAWPKNPIDQVRAVANVVSSTLAPLASEDVAARFTGRGPWKRRLEHVLEMLVAVGQAVETDGRYTQV